MFIKAPDFACDLGQIAINTDKMELDIHTRKVTHSLIKLWEIDFFVASIRILASAHLGVIAIKHHSVILSESGYARWQRIWKF